MLALGAQGSVLFTVMARKGLPTGTVTQHQAVLGFDGNAPVSTSVWFNTLDNDVPSSTVNGLAATQSTASFPVQWAGTDAGSGILDFNIYVSTDGGPFAVWLRNTTATSATFNGQTGKTYAFYSVARDGAHNLELKTAADTTTQVAGSDVKLSATAARLSPTNRSAHPARCRA